MTSGNAVHLLWGIGALALVISALVAQRPSRRTVVRSLLAWAVIGALILIAVLFRDEFGGVRPAAKTSVGEAAGVAQTVAEFT